MATTTSAPPRFHQRTTPTPAPAGSIHTRHRQRPWLSIPLDWVNDDDTRVDVLADVLGADPDHITRSIERLWGWATVNRRHGFIGDLNPAKLAQRSGWRYDPVAWHDALRDHDFIDSQGVLCDWSELGGRKRRGDVTDPEIKVLDRLAKKAGYERKRRANQRAGSATVDRHHIVGDDAGTAGTGQGDDAPTAQAVAQVDNVPRGPVNRVHATARNVPETVDSVDQLKVSTVSTRGHLRADEIDAKTGVPYLLNGTANDASRGHLDLDLDIYSVLRTEGEIARAGGDDVKTKNTTEITATVAAARAKRAPATGPAATTDATRAYRDVMRVTPNQAQRTAINAAIGQDEAALVRWRDVLTAWTLRGNKPTNVQGCLDWFAGGVPEAGGARTSSGRGGWVDAPVLTTREFGALAGEAGVRVRTMLQRAGSYANGGRMPSADAAFILQAIGRVPQAGATVTEAGPSVVIEVPVLGGDTTADRAPIVTVAQVTGGPEAQDPGAPGGSWASGRLVTRNGITLVDNGSELHDATSAVPSRRNRDVFKPADTPWEVWVQDARGEWVPRDRRETDPPLPGQAAPAPTVAMAPALPVPVVNREIGALAPRPSPEQVREDAARLMRAAVASGRWASQTQAVN